MQDRSTAFMEAFEPCRDALWRFVRSMTRTRHEAEDLHSDTVLHAFEGFDRVRDRQAFQSYLFTIASRIHRRQRWRRMLFAEWDEPAAAQLHHAGPQPDAGFDAELLRVALQRLPERQREAIVLFEILGWSLEEIRVVQGGSLSGVKTRLVRGRQMLARELGADATTPTDASTMQPSVVHAATHVAINGIAHQPPMS
jgi:RNA polymerase sigma-70 factor, ECF subfamily